MISAKCYEYALHSQSYLGCSISRFSNGDISMLTGPTLVKHGGGVTNHDSSMLLGSSEAGDRLSRPSCEPAPEWLRLWPRPRRNGTTGAFLICTTWSSSSESVWAGLSVDTRTHCVISLGPVATFGSGHRTFFVDQQPVGHLRFVLVVVLVTRLRYQARRLLDGQRVLVQLSGRN